MSRIYNNINNQSVNINQSQAFEKAKLNKENELSKNITEEVKKNDSITISEQNENIINTKKAHDAFKDTCSDFGYTETSLGAYADMSLYYAIAVDQMRSRGISVPYFTLDGKNNDFLPFVDKLKDFAKELNMSNPGFLPSQFLDFCDAFKEKLIQYGCE
ncbi:hypothetical protein GCM10008905_02420 [Clostridium malenominatum]|uniref:Uncharacterized protein n=1 Tax=Clostridium malenominatum TaxID=1539 RepID=A0ABN1IML4_9CLOT